MNGMKTGRIRVIFSLVGALGGYLYWMFIGCNTGTCPIKSVWYYSTLWGLLMGYLAGEVVIDWIKKRKTKGDE